LSKTESRSAGAARIQSRRILFVSKPTSANPTVLETLQTYSAAQNPVNDLVPQDFQMISTSGESWGTAGELPAKSGFLTINPFGMTTLRSARMHATVCAFRSGSDASFGARILRLAFCDSRFCDSPDGRQKIEKRS
jgi:hypothetical protein